MGCHWNDGPEGTGEQGNDHLMTNGSWVRKGRVPGRKKNQQSRRKNEGFTGTPRVRVSEGERDVCLDVLDSVDGGVVAGGGTSESPNDPRE